MIPVILGAVALGATGYGVKKLLTDEDFRDDVKDKIQDGALKACDGIEWAEEKMGLYNEPVSLSEVKKEFADAGMEHEYLFSWMADFNDDSTETEAEDFEKLYQLKLDIFNMLDKDNLAVIEESEIKKDDTTNITITDDMKANLESYLYLLKTSYNKIQNNMSTDVDISSYIHTLKNLWMTNIIEKGKLNLQSSDVILESINILLNRHPFINPDPSK